MNSYVDTLKLEFDPFAPNHGARHFFDGGDRKEILDQLVDLAHYGGNTLIVTGGLGCGKSTLAKAFLARFADEAATAIVPATLFMNELQLLESLCDQLALDREGLVSIDSLIGRLKDYASLLTAESRSLMIVIDDAHELGIDTIEVLANLIEASEEASVHLLFLAERQLLGVLESSMASAYGPAAMSVFELEGLSASACKEYLELKLSSAGFKGQFPLSGPVLGEIVNKSAGVPGVINSMAREELAHVEFQAAEPAASTLPRIPRQYLATAAGLFLALLLVLMLPSSDEASIDVIDASDTEQAGEQLLVDGNRRIAIAVGGNGVESTEPRATESTAEPTVVRSVEPLLAQQEPAATPDVSEATQAIDLALQMAAAKETEEELVEGLVEELAIAKSESNADYSSFERRLLESASSAYTLQLLGTHNQESARTFIDEAGGSERYGYFRTVHEGKPWFVVVFGSYASRDLASAAIESLPGEQRQLQPWARSIGGIQSDIRRASAAD